MQAVVSFDLLASLRHVETNFGMLIQLLPDMHRYDYEHW